MASIVSFRLGAPQKPVILVDVMVNGSGPYQFALDTGASVTVLSEGLVNDLRIASGDPVAGMGAGGQVAVTLTSLDSLQVGDDRVDNLQAAVMDLAPLSDAAQAQLDGIVGYTYLSKFRVTIDYRKRLLTLE